MSNNISFEDLSHSDLMIDAIYEGGDEVGFAAEPISELMHCGNQGGIRHTGSVSKEEIDLKSVILYTTFSEPDWPDYIDDYTGRFTYFGDNKQPGNRIHETKKKGNLIFKKVFNLMHEEKRENIPPFFVFSKRGKGRDVIFKGLVVPGAEEIPPTEDLVAIWKTKEGQRFQNYRAIFTILDVDTVKREWIEEIKDGDTFTDNAPEEWLRWIETGEYEPLRSERVKEHREKEEQLPSRKDDLEILDSIYDYFSNPFEFEKFSKKIVKLMDDNIGSVNLTRQWRDGGRDALGKYRIGLESDPIKVDFALEAKRYARDDSVVGVEETSRLISRLRHRQFGILVTTSFVHRQAYKEIKEDGHPIIIVSGKDIVDILKRNGYDTKEKVEDFLERNF